MLFSFVLQNDRVVSQFTFIQFDLEENTVYHILECFNPILQLMNKYHFSAFYIVTR
jgi:hypothetical protein